MYSTDISELELEKAASSGCQLATRLLVLPPSYTGTAMSKEEGLREFESRRSSIKWEYSLTILGSHYNNFEIQLELIDCLQYDKRIMFYILPHPSKPNPLSKTPLPH